MNHARSDALLFCASLLVATIATAAPLDLKLGLWQSTITTESSGAPPIDTSRLSPEQRARIEAMFKQRAARGPKTHISKSCLTKKKLAEDPASQPPEQGETCSTKIISQSSTHWQGNRVCTGNGRRREFDIDISALSRERTKGTIKVSIGDASRTMKVNGTIAGKWLASDCGSLK